MVRWNPTDLRATIRDASALRDEFARANVTGSGTIRGEQAVAFLRPSGLSDGALSKIWKAATRGTGALTSPSELGECLELVARELEQGGDGFTTPGGEAKSAFGSTPRTPASASAATVQAPPMTEAERKKYFGHFRTLDVDGKGSIGVDAAVKFLSKAALPLLSVQLCVARATRGGSVVDRDSFAVAMHDVYALIRAQGKTPVTPVATPTISAAPVPSTSEASVSMLDDESNFFSSLGAPNVGASALEATSLISLGESMPVVRDDEAARLEREAELKAQSAKREMQAAEAARAAAEARIARAQKAIDAAEEDVAAAKLAVERVEAEADRKKLEATARLEAARKQHGELMQRESRVKQEAQEAIAAKKLQYESTVAEYERLKAQVANASAVAALPVKAMQDKLSRIEEETRALKAQTDKAAADASQILMKRAVEVAKAERAKAAAMRELQAVEAKLEMETSRIEKQLEALQAETESCIAKREAKSAAHPGIVEDLQAKMRKCKEEAAAEKQKTENAIAACENEYSELKAKIALAKAEIEAAQSAMDSDLATHKLKLDERRTLFEEASEAVRQAIEKRRKIAETQASEIAALDDKITELEVALRTEEAAMDAQDQAHQEEMNSKEQTLANLIAKTDEIRSQMEDKYLMSQKALSDVEARIDAAETKYKEQQQERDLGVERLALEKDELTEKLRVAKESEERNIKDKAENDVLIASAQAEVQELREFVSVESARIEAEICEAQEDFTSASAALEAERSALSSALEKLRETLPKSAAVLAQIQALQSSKDRVEMHRMEADETAEKANATYEEALKRLQEVALEAAEQAAGDSLSFDTANAALSSALAVTTTSFEPEAKSGHERLPSFVDDFAPNAETKSTAFDTNFSDEPFGDSDVFGAPQEADNFFGGSSQGFDDSFAPITTSQSLDADAFDMNIAPQVQRQFRSFSLDDAEPEPETVAESDGFTASAPRENSFSAFENFRPEGFGSEDVFETSPRSAGFRGADAFDIMSDEKEQPQEDVFATVTPTDAESAAFTTFDNDAFVPNADAQWQDDFAVSPTREETSWNPDEYNDDAFMTAQKPDADFQREFDAPEPEANDSVFATPSGALTSQGAAFSSFDTPVPATPAEDYEDAQEEMEPEEITPIPPEDMARSNAAWEKLRNDAGSEGVTGQQIVGIATKTGLDNSDLAIIWNISSTPGASELSMPDFALFMHFLKHRVNGGELPNPDDVDAARRAYLLGVSETTEQPSSPPTILAETGDQEGREERRRSDVEPEAVNARARLRVFVESVTNVKDAQKMSSTHFSITLVDVEGTPIEPSQNTPISDQVGPDGVLRIQGGVILNSVPSEWPEGSAVVLELRHYKQKEKKMSTRCWSFMEKDSVRPGLFGLPLAAKPADAKRRKVKLYNSGNPDLKVRFTVLEGDD